MIFVITPSDLFHLHIIPSRKRILNLPENIVFSRDRHRGWDEHANKTNVAEYLIHVTEAQITKSVWDFSLDLNLKAGSTFKQRSRSLCLQSHSTSTVWSLSEVSYVLEIVFIVSAFDSW